MTEMHRFYPNSYLFSPVKNAPSCSRWWQFTGISN